MKNGNFFAKPKHEWHEITISCFNLFLYFLGNVDKSKNQNISQGLMCSQGLRNWEAIFAKLLRINLVHIVFLNNNKILQFLSLLILLAYMYCPTLCSICFKFIKFMLYCSSFKHDFFTLPSSLFF